LNPKRIAVVGGGAKAAAIAARAAVMNAEGGFQKIEVTIFEKAHVGASWTGRGGYTDGDQRLCTPIERDLGYPYPKARPTIGAAIHQNYSWSSFLLSRADNAFVKWVDGGRLPPSHKMFAEYIRWAIEESGARVVNAKVVGLRPSTTGWRVRARRSSAPRLEPEVFDSVVVTGPGPANRVQAPQSATRIFDGESMWSRLASVKRALDRPSPRGANSGPIAILGAGGTAAAILGWLVRNGFKDREIVIISSQPAFYTRGDSVFENRLFNDEDAWASLPEKSKSDFAERLNRGVVWSTVMEQVSMATAVKFEFGTAERVFGEKDGSYRVSVSKPDGPPLNVPAQVVFDAIGFQDAWWLELIEHESVLGSNKRELKEALRSGMLGSLMLAGPSWDLPPLYAPMLASTIGPGFQSLMSLGGMAHRVIEDHLTEV
jgi:mycobactin lysine-N-oxygenase